jgi:tRNA threonylcarbamoyladenosine biosynthesis protein TsaB
MITLALDTSSAIESVAVFSKKKILGQISWKGNYDETKKLLAAIEKILKKAHLNFFHIDRIIVACGPGSFTGLRIGVTVANVLALILKKPLYAVRTVGKNVLSLKPPRLRKEFPVIPKYSKPPNITKPRP